MTRAEERRGWTAVPDAMRDAARAELELAQRALLVELAAECNWGPGTATVDGVQVELDRGEVLLSTRGFAERQGASRDQVRRFLDRVEALGWISRRPAAPRAAPPHAPPAAPRAAPPPTVVRFERWREILWPERQAAPSPAPSPAPRAAPLPAPIPPVEPIHLAPERPSPSPSATASAPEAQQQEHAKKSPNPRHTPLKAVLVSLYERIRATKYNFDGKADPPAINRLLQLADDGEIIRCWGLGLEASSPFRCDTIAQLASPRVWNHLATQGARQARKQAKPGGWELDPAWLASLAPNDRAAAESEWNIARESLKRSAWPDALPGLLDEHRVDLVARFSSPVAARAAGGRA